MDQAATNLREVAVMHIHGNRSGGLITAQRLLSRAVRLAPHRCDCAYWLATAMERRLGRGGDEVGSEWAEGGVDRAFGPSDLVQARAAASAPHDVAALMHKCVGRRTPLCVGGLPDALALVARPMRRFWNVIACGVRPNASDGETPGQVSHSPAQVRDCPPPPLRAEPAERRLPATRGPR